MESLLVMAKLYLLHTLVMLNSMLLNTFSILNILFGSLTWNPIFYHFLNVAKITIVIFILMPLNSLFRTYLRGESFTRASMKLACIPSMVIHSSTNPFLLQSFSSLNILSSPLSRLFMQEFEHFPLHGTQGWVIPIPTLSILFFLLFQSII